MTRLLILLALLSNGVFAQTAQKLSRPEKDFETFWKVFKDNYAFFQLKGVNWDSTYQKYRATISKKTNQQQLVTIFGQMVDPLKDGHITISKGDEILYKCRKPSQFKLAFKGLEKQFWQTVDTTLIKNAFPTPIGVGPVFKDEHLYYYSRSDHAGYIRITRCFANPESIFDDTKEADDTRLMLQLFDSLLNQLSNTDALMVDLRANGGGHGGLELASRFVKTRTLTHYKSIKVKGKYENFSPLEAQYIAPNQGTQYLKQLIILTNDKTASSAEDFTISLYKQDNVTTVGTNTSGMLSDMFSGELSNNIQFTLSNQVYYSVDKQILEDKGVPVTYQVVNTQQDIEKNEDPLIVKAMQLIRQNSAP